MIAPTTKQVIDALNERIKTLSTTADAEQLTYLAKAIEATTSQSNEYSIAERADITMRYIEYLIDRHTRDVYDQMNYYTWSYKLDIPNDSTAMKEIKKSTLGYGDKPFLFGIGGANTITTTGVKADNIRSCEDLFRIATMRHGKYVRFMPIVSFLSEDFLFRTRHVNDSLTPDVELAIAVFFVRNDYNSAQNAGFTFGGSISTTDIPNRYAAVFVGTPDADNSNRADITTISWIRHSLTTSTTDGDARVTFSIPAYTTVAVMCYRTSDIGSTYTELRMQISSFISAVKIDIDRTAKAAHPTSASIIDIWK